MRWPGRGWVWMTQQVLWNTYHTNSEKRNTHVMNHLFNWINRIIITFHNISTYATENISNSHMNTFEFFPSITYLTDNLSFSDMGGCSSKFYLFSSFGFNTKFYYIFQFRERHFIIYVFDISVWNLYLEFLSVSSFFGWPVPEKVVSPKHVFLLFTFLIRSQKSVCRNSIRLLALSASKVTSCFLVVYHFFVRWFFSIPCPLCFDSWS